MMLEADDFAADPYGHITNQAGHAQLVGVPMALLGLIILPPVAVPVLVAVLYGLIWEVLIQPQPKGWADSLMDTACVMAGASILCGAFHYIPDFWPAWRTVAACFVAYAVVVGVGALRRWQP